MLVLTLKPDEQIHIGDDIVLTLTRILDTGRVKLGVEAPPEVTVLREELLSNIREE